MSTVDLRLVAPAAVVWAITALVLSGTVAGAVRMAGVAAVAGFAVAALWRGGKMRWEVAGPVLMCAALATCVALTVALRMETRDRHPAHDIRGKTTMVVTLRDDPTGYGPPAAGRIRARVEIRALARGAVPAVPAELIGRAQAWHGLTPGQQMRVLVTVRPPPGGTLLVARLDAAGVPHLLGRPPPAQRAATHIRERLQRNASRALPAGASGLFPGLVLGDESALSTDLREEFRDAGLLHLTAVSGANFAVVIGAVIMLLRLAGAPPRTVVVMGALAVIGFVIVVRPSPSVLRAALMGAVGLLALLSARRAQAVPALAAAVIGGVLWWPELATAPGFGLSVAATAGLVVIAPGIRDALRRVRTPVVLAELMAMAVAAHLMTAPMIAYLSGTFSLVSVLANVAVAPVVGVIGICGTAAALVGLVGADEGVGTVGAELLIRGMSPEMWWMITCARGIGGWRWAVIDVPEGWGGAVVVGAVMVAVSVLTVLGVRSAGRVAPGLVAWCRRGLARWAP